MPEASRGLSPYCPQIPFTQDSRVEPASNVCRGLLSRCKKLTKEVSFNPDSLSTFIIVGSVIALFAIGFFSVFFSLAPDSDMAYRIARGTGGAMKVLLPFIFLPTLRLFHAKAYKHAPLLFNNALTKKIFHNRILFHKKLGETFLASATVHTTAHIYRMSVPFSSQECLTGICMLVLTILPIASMYALRSSRLPLAAWSFKRLPINKSYYRQFLIPHQLGWWGLIGAYGIHTRDLRLLFLALAVMSVFCVDRVWEWIESRNVSVKEIEKVHDEMIVVEVDKPKKFAFTAGEKVYVSWPPTYAFFNDLHPFTIASSPEEKTLRFIISASGDWTSYLIRTLNKGDKVRVSPPYPSLLDSSKSEDERLLITSGSGIAMTLAHLHDSKDRSRIHIIHTTRNREELEFLHRFAEEMKPKVNVVGYYDTSESKAEGSADLGECSKYITQGRFYPENHEFLKRFTGRIYFCGNELLGKSIEKAVSINEKVVFLREKFSF